MAPRTRVWLLRLLVFEIHIHLIAAVLAFAAAPLTILIVAAITVHLADRGLQIMQIGFDLPINRIFGAVFTTAVLPALALMAELLNRMQLRLARRAAPYNRAQANPLRYRRWVL